MNVNHSMKYVDDIKIDTVRGLHVIKIHDLFNKKTQFSLLCNYLSVGLFHSFQYKRPKRIKSDIYFQSPGDGSPYLNPGSSDYRRSGVLSGLNNDYFWSLFFQKRIPSLNINVNKMCFLPLF